MGSPPRGERVGIWRTRIRQPGSTSSLNRSTIAAAIARTSSSPNRIPMQIRGPPPNGM